MKFVILRAFNDYIGAHMLKGQLEEAGIQSWLKDEYSVTIDPILSNSVGGIKVMVHESDHETALQIIKQIESDFS